MTINEAIKDYKKAQKEYIAANEKAQAISEENKGLWSRIYTNKFTKDSEEYTAAVAADLRESNAITAANYAKAIVLAASDNVLSVARNTIIKAIKKRPEKFNKPLHYKVMKENLKLITGEEFYIYDSYNTAYLVYRDATGERQKFVLNLTDENKFKLDDNFINNISPELTLKEIKKEAKQAIKDAEKLRKEAAKLEALYAESKAKYNSHIKYIMPGLKIGLIEDKYRLL